jgi:ATP-dependent DNA helicase RecQ
MTLPSDIEQALAKFGLRDFRPGQREVIESIVAGEDSLCIMPTGGGKSLCYQLPSIIRSGLTIVVSPLIALMKDQVDSLSSRGISAALINSSLSASEQAERLQAVASGHYQLVYVAPERLRNNRFLEAIRATPIQLLAVDEAHCISQWGHDFRPDYTRIGRFRELLGGVQTVALTATATPKVRQDIVEVLKLSQPKEFMSGFARPNLHFGVVSTNGDRDKERELESFLSQDRGSGIIYCATRKRCEAVVELISSKLKLKVGAYHGGLMPEQRRVIQERFMKDELKIVVATNAFGMGIDKPDLRFVVHFNMPGSLEAYYQEAGRAGRDGKLSQCVMLYAFQDRRIQEFFIDNNYPEPELIKSVYEFLLEQQDEPIELTLEEMRDRLGLSVSPEAIGSCLQILARTKVLDRLEMGGGMAMVRIDSDLPTLVDLLPREAKVRRQVLRTLEQTIGERRGEEVYVHPRWLLQKSGMQREPLNRALRELNKLEAVDYVPPFRGRAVHFRRRDLEFRDLGIDFDNLRARKQTEYDRLNQVVTYAQAPVCRQTTILRYFGDASAEPCGRCDRCQRSPGWPAMAANSKSGSQVGKLQSSKLQSGKPTDRPRSEEDSSGLEAGLTSVVEAIERTHGRLGKHLISQYLCGSQNAKIQKLNLHRLSGFGLLKGLRQSDAVELLDALLAAGLLKQKEVNRNRPTVQVAAEWMDVAQRPQLLSMTEIPPRVATRLRALQARQPRPPQESQASRVNPETRHATHTEESQPKPPSLSRGTSSLENADPSTGRRPAEGSAEQHRTASANEQTLGPDETQDAMRSPSTAGRGKSGQPDWVWTVALFEKRFSWNEVMEIRRMDDDDLAASLCAALRAGQSISRSWVPSAGDQPLSGGQRRVVRELQRRAAAGV